MAKAKEGEVVKPKEENVEPKRSSTTMIILIVVVVIVALCGLCALCGSVPFFLDSLDI